MRQKIKLNKKLTGTVTSHIEQLMMARVQEDRGVWPITLFLLRLFLNFLFSFRQGPTAPSQLKVLRKDDEYLKTLKANKGRHSKGQKNKRKQVKQAGGVQPPANGQ